MSTGYQCLWPSGKNCLLLMDGSAYVNAGHQPWRRSLIHCIYAKIARKMQQPQNKAEFILYCTCIETDTCIIVIVRQVEFINGIGASLIVAGIIWRNCEM